MEGELGQLEEKAGVRPPLWIRLLESWFSFKERHTTHAMVKRSTYLKLCLLGLFGVHHFYAHHYIRGFLYLAFCWTGIPLALGFIDWMEAVPRKADENGLILI